jgi:hypothetical protein
MASNLNEYYQSLGQTLPTVTERQDVATKAGITGYTGTKDQNKSLLGYLKSTPSQGGTNVITSDNLTQEKPVQIKPPVPDTSSVGMNSAIGSFLESTKASAAKKEAELQKQQAEYAKGVKESGDQGAFAEQIIQERGIDKKQEEVDRLSSQIEQEQKATMDRINEVRKTFTGTAEGLNAEIARIQRESSNEQANLSIRLSAANRNYETAANIANRLITSNSEKIKADLESRKFILDQIGTDLAREKSNVFTLQTKALDKEDAMLKDFIKTATDMAADGTVDGKTSFQAVQDVLSGKISLSDGYAQVGGTDQGLIDGYGLKKWAKDPQYEQHVAGVYETLPEISTPEEVDNFVKTIASNSPINGKDLFAAASKYDVDPKLMLAMMIQETGQSSLGMSEVAKKNNNFAGLTWSSNTDKIYPGSSKGSERPDNEGGNYIKFPTAKDGLDAYAKLLSAYKVPTTPKLKSLSIEDFAKLNSTEQAQNINNGTHFAQTLKDYRAAIEKWGTGEIYGQGSGELNSAYQSVVGAIKDYYKLGTLDNGVEKLVELGIPKPWIGGIKSARIAGVDTQIKSAITEIVRNAEQLALNKEYSGSIEANDLVNKARALKEEQELEKKGNDAFLATIPSSTTPATRINNTDYFNSFQQGQ